jgi:protein-arginine kinase activator protein McsA
LARLRNRSSKAATFPTNSSPLQKKLDKAVEQEDFEQAAQIRDEIKNTKEKLTELTA